jgi:hypothetical protein
MVRHAGARHVVLAADDPYSYFGAPNTYVGAVYRTTGPPFNSFRFNPLAVTATQVGSGGISFSTNDDDTPFDNGDKSRFWFTTSEGYISKVITREIFASPVSACVEGGDAGTTPNFQGMWWNASEAGWGLHLTHQDDIVFAVWFTYDAERKATWLAMTANNTAPRTYAGSIYRTTGPPYNATTFDPSKVTGTQVGSGTLMFADRNNGTFSYSVDDAIVQTKNIARQVFADPPTVCNQ